MSTEFFKKSKISLGKILRLNTIQLSNSIIVTRHNNSFRKNYVTEKHLPATDKTLIIYIEMFVVFYA